ncbi:hypothetical protein JXL21_13005 [Candidatus Bathyarchaeota archaeon]|nr:hypothetical protein [Candidatus Bathyarchaeota archaeon]
MERNHRSVIADMDNVEIVELVKKDIQVNDCYGVASDLLFISGKGTRLGLNETMFDERRQKQYILEI